MFRKFKVALFFVTANLCLIISTTGCSNIFSSVHEHDRYYQSNQASFDETGQQTSGIIGIFEDENGCQWFIVTQGLVLRYKDLRGKYENTNLFNSIYPGKSAIKDAENLIQKHSDGVNYKMPPMLMSVYRVLVIYQKNQVKE